MGRKDSRPLLDPQAIRANRIARAPFARLPAQQVLPPPLTKCNDTTCSVRQDHEAKVYAERDPSTPKIVTQWEASIKTRLARGLPIYKSPVTQLLDEWYAVHAVSRLTHCTDPGCPVNIRHDALVYREGDPATPQIVIDWETRVQDRLARGLPINKSQDRKQLSKWYIIHDPSRLSLIEPGPSRCTNPLCPVTDPHREGFFVEDAEDLPITIKRRAARVLAAWARDVDTFNWQDNVFLDKLFRPDVHGVKIDAAVQGSEPSGSGSHGPAAVEEESGSTHV